MPARILIADDDPTIRSLLRRLLEKERNWQVCAEASNGVEAIEKVKRIDPDLVVMDLSMPVMTGLQAAPEIVKARPHLPMLLISVEEVSNELANAARNLGYRGVVTKSNGVEVLKAIDILLRNETSCSSGESLAGSVYRKENEPSPNAFEEANHPVMRSGSSMVHEITWNPDSLKWFCAQCGRTSDDLREEDAESEIERFPCESWRYIIRC